MSSHVKNRPLEATSANLREIAERQPSTRKQDQSERHLKTPRSEFDVTPKVTSASRPEGVLVDPNLPVFKVGNGSLVPQSGGAQNLAHQALEVMRQLGKETDPAKRAALAGGLMHAWNQIEESGAPVSPAFAHQAAEITKQLAKETDPAKIASLEEAFMKDWNRMQSNGAQALAHQALEVMRQLGKETDPAKRAALAGGLMHAWNQIEESGAPVSPAFAHQAAEITKQLAKETDPAKIASLEEAFMKDWNRMQSNGTLVSPAPSNKPAAP